MKRRLLGILVTWLISLILLIFWHDKWQAVFLAFDLYAFSLYIVIDLWQSDKKNENWQDLANRDELTGLLNRRGLLAVNISAPYSLLMIDIDQFKLINDKHGHATGDAVLQQFSEHLLKNTRQGDICARWGGDEFVVLLANTDKQTTKAFTKRLKQSLTHNESTPLFNFSVGYSDSNEAEGMKQLIDLADTELLKTKSDR